MPHGILLAFGMLAQDAGPRAKSGSAAEERSGDVLPLEANNKTHPEILITPGEAMTP
jgi:hypothetical protein